MKKVCKDNITRGMSRKSELRCQGAGQKNTPADWQGVRSRVDLVSVVLVYALPTVTISA